MRLKSKPSESTINNDIQLWHDITALPYVYRQSSHEHWKEIHVIHDFEQRSMKEGRMSDGSQKDLYTGLPRPMGRR